MWREGRECAHSHREPASWPSSGIGGRRSHASNWLLSRAGGPDGTLRLVFCHPPRCSARTQHHGLLQQDVQVRGQGSGSLPPGLRSSAQALQQAHGGVRRVVRAERSPVSSANGCLRLPVCLRSRLGGREHTRASRRCSEHAKALMLGADALWRALSTTRCGAAAPRQRSRPFRARTAASSWTYARPQTRWTPRYPAAPRLWSALIARRATWSSSRAGALCPIAKVPQCPLTSDRRPCAACARAQHARAAAKPHHGLRAGRTATSGLGPT